MKNNQCSNDNDEMMLARAYVPAQPYTDSFPLDAALRKGTLFPNLYMPYKIRTMENKKFRRDCDE